MRFTDSTLSEKKKHSNLSEKEKHDARVQHEKKRVRREQVLEQEHIKRGPGFWFPHTLYLPKDINHSEPTEIVSYHFVKVPADRFLNLQCHPGSDTFGLSDDYDDESHCSPQFWYSKDCETEEDYLRKNGTEETADLPASNLGTAADSLLALRKTTDTI